MKNKRIVKRGEIYYVDLGFRRGSEQGGLRPAVVISNDIGNKYGPTVIVAAITSRQNKAKIPTHIELKVADRCGLPRDSVVLCEQIRTIDKDRLEERVGSLSEDKMREIDAAVSISFALVMADVGIAT